MLVGPMALGAKTTVGTASGSDPAELTVLHHRSADPVDAWVVADELVRHINHDDLKELESGVRVHPVRVEHTVNAVALLGFVAEAAGLVGACWASCAMDGGQL